LLSINSPKGTLTMRKILLVLVAAVAVSFAGCNKEKSETPSIADTSAKQMQPADDQAAANTDQSQGTTQDQAAAAPDQSSQDQAALGMAPADNNNAQVDENQNSQAQIPSLPDTGAAPADNAANPANPQ
jgi:hypothetical protein